MSDVDTALRAGEIAISAAGALVRLIVEAMESGKKEDEALRHALSTLSAQPDLTPALPRVRAMISRERARIIGRAKTDPPPSRSDEPTAEVPLPGFGGKATR